MRLANSRHYDISQDQYRQRAKVFNPSRFNAEEWADLFARAGATFAGPVAMHHDHFANWDSKVTRWNSMAMGPKRDITGELEQAVRGHGMRFMAPSYTRQARVDDYGPCSGGHWLRPARSPTTRRRSRTGA